MRKSGFLFLLIVLMAALVGCAKDGAETAVTTGAGATVGAVTAAVAETVPDAGDGGQGSEAAGPGAVEEPAVSDTAEAGATESAETAEGGATVASVAAATGTESASAGGAEGEAAAETESGAAEGGHETTVGSPDDGILLSFADEKAFLASDYPDIPLHGSASEEEADQLVEALSDMLSVKAADAGITEDFIYGDCTTETLWPDEEKGARIVESYLSAGNPLMDEVMHREGYTDYHLTYYYPRLAWVPAGEKLCAPVLADLWIGNNEYRYFFLNGELIRRDGPNGESLNPETNRFMNSVYKLGCYYGNVVDKPRDRYFLFITSMEQITEQDGSFVITCNIQGRDKPWSFTVDADTDFSADCETGSFSGYRAGESGYEWYRRAYETLSAEDFDEDFDGGSDFTMTALVGIFEIQTSGSHVDELCGCYWWD